MVVILGFTGVLGKLISLETSYLVWYRMLIAWLALFLFLLLKNQLKKIKKEHVLPLLGIGAIVALHWIFFFEAIKVSNVSIAVICLSTSSLYSAFLEPIIFKRKFLKYEVYFGLVVLLALAYMLGGKEIFNGITSEYIEGYIYGILSAFLATLFTLFNAKFLEKSDASQITMIEMLGGTILLSLFFIYSGDYTVITKTVILTDVYYLLILGIICTALVFVWMVEIMRHITPYAVIMAVNLEPIYSILLALIIFQESELMEAPFYIGASIILFTVFLDGYIKNKQDKLN